MPPTVLRRTDSSDPLKKYWWVVLLLVVFAGTGILTLMPKGTGSGGGGPSLSGASDQSLESIDQGLNTVGAPGTPMGLSMEGSYRRADASNSTMVSSLYESPEAKVKAGDKPAGVAESASSAAGGSLADALKNVANRPSKSDNKGWGEAAARSGFTPAAKLAKMSGAAGAGGGGGSSASMSVGGNTGGSWGTAGGGGGGVAPVVGEGGGAGGPPKVRKGGYNQAFDVLKQVEKNLGKAANSDMAANLGSKSYDGATLKSNAGTPQLTGLGDGQVLGRVDAVPENLKLDDPKLQKKDIKVPEVGKDKEAAKTGPDMEQQMMMMLMQMAIAGIAGPMFSAVGTTMANAMFNTNMRPTTPSMNLSPTGQNPPGVRPNP